MAHKYFDPVRADVEKELEERRLKVCVQFMRIINRWKLQRKKRKW